MPSNELYSTKKMLIQESPEILSYPEDKFKNILFLPPKEGRKGEGGLRTKGYFKKSYKNKPLVSIITAVFNGEKYIEQTIRSVLKQTYDNIEYIIIDGGSSDQTLEIIKNNECYLDYWVSESDEGISDAFNKGVKTSTGDIICILNADDWYEPNSIQMVVENFYNADILYGEMNLWRDGQRLSTPTPDHTKLIDDMTLRHPSTFLKRHVYTSIGLFNPSYKLAMDYELLLRAYDNGFSFKYINAGLSNMQDGGISTKYWLNATKEVRKAKIEQGRIWVNAYFYYFKHVILSKHFIYTFFNEHYLGFIPSLYLYIKNKLYSLTEKQFNS